MHSQASQKIIHASLRALAMLVPVVLVVLFVITALRRLRYPFELEELEGYVFLSALRVFQGLPLYPHPSLDFIPYMYPPLYFYASAALGHIMGMTIGALRLLSIVSTLGCFGVIYALVFREVKKHAAALAAVGLYAGCYTLTGCWYDLGRLDSLFILLLLLAMYATRFSHPVLAALLWLVCFFTKQSILPAAFLMLCCDWRQIRKTASGVVTLSLSGLATMAWANHVTNGWYSFYVFKVPAANADIKLRTLAVFLPEYVLRPLGLAVALILAAILLTAPSLRSPATRFYLSACSLVPLFWWIRSHAGSTANADMPVYALLAVLFGIAFARLEAWTETLDAQHAWTPATVLLLCVVAQTSAGLYNPGDYVPSPVNRAALTSIVDQLRRTPGDVYVMQHPYYGWLAGKPIHADLTSIHDAERLKGAVRTELQQELQAQLTGQRFTALALDAEEVADGIDSLAVSPTWRDFYKPPVSMTRSRVPLSPALLIQHQ